MQKTSQDKVAQIWMVCLLDKPYLVFLVPLLLDVLHGDKAESGDPKAET